MAVVKIDIASEFTGKKAFKQAETSTDKLTKGVKRLSGALAVAFSARGIGRSVKAFAEDDKAARALGQTLNNLGLAFGSNSATVNGYISRLEQQTGVLDDELRPAMDRFLRATLSVTKSQELLNLALDISAGTGKSVTQVSQSLQKAYLGQTQALGRLGVGLSKAELTSSNFEEIQARLSVLFAGQASTAADTYAGQLAKLQVAANNAKETIGKGFVDALITASGSTTIDPVIAGIGKVSNAIAAFTRETGKAIAITKSLFDPKNFFFMNNPAGGFKGMGNISLSVSSQDTQKADLAARKKAEEEARRQAAALLKAQNALLKSQKDALKLNKAKAIFDLQKIQIEAALKGKLSEEDKMRLLLMQAIEEENISNIEKYTKLLDEAQKKTIELREILKGDSPFSSWLTGINQVLAGMFSIGTQIQANGREWSSYANQVAMTTIQSNGREFSSSFSPSSASTPTSSPVVNNVTVNAGVGDPEAIARVIEDTLRQSTYRGTGGLLAL
jgi:hypothetical protein